MYGSEKELELFKKYFGEYKIINNLKGDNMAKQEVFKETKKIDVISVTPAQYGNHYKVVSTDGITFSTFDKTVGEQFTGISDGDIVEVEYFVSAKGFKTLISLKLVDNDKEIQKELPGEEQSEPREEYPKRSVDRIDKNCISAMQGALKLMEHLDLSKFKEEGIVEKFKGLWQIIGEEIEK